MGQSVAGNSGGNRRLLAVSRMAFQFCSFLGEPEFVISPFRIVFQFRVLLYPLAVPATMYWG